MHGLHTRIVSAFPAVMLVMFETAVLNLISYGWRRLFLIFPVPGTAHGKPPVFIEIPYYFRVFGIADGELFW